ncbi:mercuric ion transport protein [Tistlia consotensis]|uniref:Mercuric transport protein MerT n=1 Tax=Tistlia consotensis USBA 355 TaxID=560819 RepID=A0A1Y6BS48_9PROT|nr:mercuric transporter MerT family protein [Tistlia consotensis]SMF26504.1 mercuric ion transport protein [Tistlia consotensis USBA 355]SNR67078.1 mercuric ion transport protein [Tistlia consotensis]
MARSEEALLNAAEDPGQLPADRTRAGWAAAGGLLGAIGASSCCILPLILFSLGAGGAWIGNVTALAPYQPIFIAITLAFLGYAFYAVYWKPRRPCANGAACARPLPRRIVKGALSIATALVAAAVAFPYAAPWLLGIQ